MTWPLKEEGSEIEIHVNKELNRYREAMNEIREALNKVKLFHSEEENNAERKKACELIHEVLERFNI